MRVGLIDVDGRNFPNLALMKVSAFHKAQGDSVEWVNYTERYDRVYSSKIFTFSHEVGTVIQAPEVIRGGTGYERDFASWVNKRERLMSCNFMDFEPRKGFKCSTYFK